MTAPTTSRRIDDAALGQAIGLAGVAEPSTQVGESVRVELDGLVRHDLGQGRRIELEAIDDGETQGARARTVLAQDERRGSVESVPDLGQLAADEPTECRVQLGRRQEVAVTGRAGRGLHVVAPLVVIQGDLHEPGEGDGSIPPDLLAEPLDEDRVALDGRRIEPRCRPPGERRVDRHGERGPALAWRATSRRAGPTRVCPPRTIGIGAPAALAVRAASQGSRMRIGQEEVGGEAILGGLARRPRPGRSDAP